jgi:hypothetical protein
MTQSSSVTDRRVARWKIFRPKTGIWVNFAMTDVGMFYEHLVYFMAL